MFTTAEPETLFLHATMQFGNADAVSHALGHHRLSNADRPRYQAAIDALEDVEAPLERGEALHAAIGALWGSPRWADMQGPERAAYVFAAGLPATVDGVIPLPSGRPGADTPAARKAWDEAAKDHPHHASLRKKNKLAK